MPDVLQVPGDNVSGEPYLSAHSAYLLGQMLRRALLDIRLLGRRGSARQASDLADAFHNLPTQLMGGRLDLERFRRDLVAYQALYSSSQAASYDYLEALDRVVQAQKGYRAAPS